MHYKKFNISAVSYKVKLNVKEENFPLNRKINFSGGAQLPSEIQKYSVFPLATMFNAALPSSLKMSF